MNFNINFMTQTTYLCTSTLTSTIYMYIIYIIYIMYIIYIIYIYIHSKYIYQIYIAKLTLNSIT